MLHLQQKKRIEDLEQQLDEIDAKILKEKSKEKVQISKEEITKFIRTTLKKEPKQILKLLINNIVLFDDKIEIHYNYIDPKRENPDDDHQDFLFYNDYYETIIDHHKFNTKPVEIKMNINSFI